MENLMNLKIPLIVLIICITVIILVGMLRKTPTDKISSITEFFKVFIPSLGLPYLIKKLDKSKHE